VTDFAGTYDADGLRMADPGPATGTGVICRFDGFLDNSGELRRAVGEGPGKGDEGAADLVARAYERFGAEAVERLRGDFAILLWDPARRRGLLARDQLGVRPLFVAERGGTLRFATELQRLIDLLPGRPGPDRVGVAHWITAGRRPDLGTLYMGVRRLGPAEMLVFENGGRRSRRYWTPRYAEPSTAGPEESAAEIREMLQVGARRRLGATGPTAVLLSGGLDSSSVAAASAAVSPGSLLALSARFPEHPVVDESELIDELRARLGIDGPFVDVRPGGLLAGALSHQAEVGVPLLSWGDFWGEPLLRAAVGKGAVMVFGGDGGDELFAPRIDLIADTLRAGRPRRARALLDRFPGAGPSVPRRQVYRAFGSQALTALPNPVLGPLLARRERRDAPGWLRPATRRDLFAAADPVAERRLSGPLWWSTAAHGLSMGLEANGVFEHQRNRARRLGIEARHPLLDLDMVELSLRLSPADSLDPRFSRPQLRAAMAGLLPDSVRLRPAKARFESIVVDCLDGPDFPAIRDLLIGRDAQLGDYVDPVAFGADLLDGGAVPRRSFRWMWLVWRCLTAEIWLRAEAGGGKSLSVPATPADLTENGPVSTFSRLDPARRSNILFLD
jgi:asparagine synthase (glutamine-hydrolysing)